MSEDPILDGHPISSLKVVDLRRELDRFGLSKTGVKKELFERLRDHLNSQANGEAQQAEVEEEPEPQVKPSTRSSASPRKSPTKTSPAKAASPTKSPMNKYVAQYLQNQQATLESAKRNADLVRTTSSSETELPPEPASTPVESQSEPKLESQLEVEPKVETPVESQPKAQVASQPEVESLSKASSTKSQPPVEIQPEPQVIIPDANKLIPPADRDEVSSTVSNAGSETAPQTIADDASIPEEETKLKETSIEAPEVAKEEDEKKRSRSPSLIYSSSSSREASAEPAKKKKQTKKPDEPQSTEKSQPSKDDSMDTSQPLNEESSQKDEGEIADEKPAKKHRAIVFDLDEKPRRSSGERMSAVIKNSITRPIVTAKPPDEPPEHGLNSLGNVRIRSLSPPRRDPSQIIHITYLKRPFPVVKLQAVLKTFGDYENEDFWIDDLRSNCMVKYKTVDDAKKARDEMHNIKWPDTPKAPMICVDFTSEEKFQLKKDPSTARKGSLGNGTAEKSGFTIHIANDRKSSTEKKEEAQSEHSDESRKRKATPPHKNDKPLDELFKKTKAKPHIYYLPLTSEQITANAEAKKRRKQ